MEVTAENMAFLYKEVSEVSASAQSTATNEEGGDSSQPEDCPRMPPKPVRGLTFVEARSCWVLRYKDTDGHPRQKRFRVRCDPEASAEYEAAKAEARCAAVSWRGEWNTP